MYGNNEQYVAVKYDRDKLGVVTHELTRRTSIKQTANKQIVAVSRTSRYGK